MMPTVDSNMQSVVGRFSKPGFPTDPLWLAEARNSALERLSTQKFPTLQDEDWRFTNVSPITSMELHPAPLVIGNDPQSRVIADSPLATLPGHRLVFINGFFCSSLSRIHPVPGGVKIESLAAALTGDSVQIKHHLGRHASTHRNAFTELNEAGFTDGAFIFVPMNTEVAEPVHIIYISSAKHSGETIQTRNLIIAEPNSKVTIVESFLSTNNTSYLTNTVTEIFAGDGANVEHVKVQDEANRAYHVATISGEFSRSSRVSVHSFALGSRLSRNNIRTKLAGEGLECILNGLYLTKGEQLADHHMIVEHAQPHCASHEYFNGILDDKSKGVFHGRILVREIAQKTDAKQTNKNLLLSDEATADTKPQLEIYADDVKCTHGATIGRLNAESIFYLRSRGMSEDMARRMLIHAFAGEIIERIQCEPAREVLDRLVWDRLETSHNLAGK